MKLYFSSNQISQLADFSFTQKQQIIAAASTKLKPTSKLVLNILKLLILIPPFLMLASLDSWWLFLPLVLIMVGYFVLLRPLSLFFIAQHIDEAVEEFNHNNINE